MFVYKPVRDGILAVHTVRYPAVRTVVDHRRPVPVPVPDHKPVRTPDQLDHKPFMWDENRLFERKQKKYHNLTRKSIISSHVPDRLDEQGYHVGHILDTVRVPVRIVLAYKPCHLADRDIHIA